MYNKYPYTDFHELNLDWILKHIKTLEHIVHDFEVVNRITWGGEHDPGKEYPKWCIVDTPAHDGYISIQPVPAGITVDNEDYWIKVANYSALYADFQTRLIACEDNITALQEDMTKVKDRYAVYIGNSFCQGVGSTSGSRGMFELTKDMFTDAWLYADGARGLVDYDTFTTNNYLDLLNQAIADSAFDNNLITDVIMVGAYGDVRAINAGVAESDFVTNANAIVTNAKAAFPNLRKISYANAHAQYDFNARGYLFSFNPPWKADCMLARILPIAGIQYLGWMGWNLMFRSEYFSSDYVHPNDAGYDYLSGMFKDAYEGGTIKYEPYVMTTAANIEGHACESYYALGRDEYTFSLGRIDRRVSGVPTSLDFTAGTPKLVKIGNPSFMYMHPLTSRSGEIVCRLMLNDGTNPLLCTNMFVDTQRPGFYDLAINPVQTVSMGAYDINVVGLSFSGKIKY